MIQRSRLSLAAVAVLCSVAMSTALVVASTTSASAQEHDHDHGDDHSDHDHGDQVIDPSQPFSVEPGLLSSGHVDIGPVFNGDDFTLAVHDDTVEPPVWRASGSTVLWVNDAALTEMPADETYSFVGAEPGAPVYVVSQTQNPDVVWLGWNTQAPSVRDRVDRGVTLSLVDVQGPGEMSVYLQAGNFTAPDVLWNTTTLQAEPQPMWIDLNTHTHANWIFTEPGVYLVELDVSARLVDGTDVNSTELLRFAVGDDADPDEAAVAQMDHTGHDHDHNRDDGAADADDHADDHGDGDDAGHTNDDEEAPGNRSVIIAVVAAAVVLAGVVGVRSSRSRRSLP